MQVVIQPMTPRDVERRRSDEAFGKHKGYGLMVMCELLGGALGGLFTMQPGNPRLGNTINNMLSVIIDPKAVGDRDAFEQEVSAMIDYIYESEPAEGLDGVLIPGDPERESKKGCCKKGLTLTITPGRTF